MTEKYPSYSKTRPNRNAATGIGTKWHVHRLVVVQCAIIAGPWCQRRGERCEWLQRTNSGWRCEWLGDTLEVAKVGGMPLRHAECLSDPAAIPPKSPAT